MSGALSPLPVYNFMMWTQSTLRFKVTIKVTVSTYSSGYVSSLKAANGFVFSIDQFNEVETKRHVAEDLNPQHHLLSRSNLSALHQSEHYMYCQRYPV